MAYETLKGAIASNGDRQDIPVEQDSDLLNGISYDEGYASITSVQKSLGGLPANRATLNQFFYITSSNLFEFQSGNFPTFNTNALQYMDGGGYPLNAILWCEAEERFVKSAIVENDDNFITNPTVIGSSWLFLNDDEVSDLSTGLTLSNTNSSVSVNAGFTKSSTSGRILKVTSTLTNTWNDIQSNSSLTPSANSKYNLYLAYNPTTTTYAILASSYSVFAPSLPSGYVDYALLGYMSTDNNIGVNNVYPDMDINDWYLTGGVLKDRLPRFCANNGYVDTDGEADLMSVSGATITWKIDDGTTYKPLVCTPANELKSFTLTSVNNFDASTLADGEYTLCINKYGNITAMGNLYAQKAEPDTPSSNDIWLNTSVEPLNAYYYTGSWVTFNNVPIAKITVESATITASETLPYNKNYTIKELSNMLGRIDVDNMEVISLSGTISFPYEYIFKKDGYIALTKPDGTNQQAGIIIGAGSGGTASSITCFYNEKEIITTTTGLTNDAIATFINRYSPLVIGTYASSQSGVSGLLSVSAGDKIRVVRNSGTRERPWGTNAGFTFYPQKEN